MPFISTFPPSFVFTRLHFPCSDLQRNALPIGLLDEFEFPHVASFPSPWHLLTRHMFAQLFGSGFAYALLSDEQFMRFPMMKEFYTSPKTQVCCVEDQPLNIILESPSTLIPLAIGMQRMLLLTTAARLGRRHAKIIRQLTTPPPVVTSPPHSPLKAYQRLIKV